MEEDTKLEVALDPAKIPDIQLIFGSLAALMMAVGIHGSLFEETARRSGATLTKSGTNVPLRE